MKAIVYLIGAGVCILLRYDRAVRDDATPHLLITSLLLVVMAAAEFAADGGT